MLFPLLLLLLLLIFQDALAPTFLGDTMGMGGTTSVPKGDALGSGGARGAAGSSDGGRALRPP